MTAGACGPQDSALPGEQPSSGLPQAREASIGSAEGSGLQSAPLQSSSGLWRVCFLYLTPEDHLPRGSQVFPETRKVQDSKERISNGRTSGLRYSALHPTPAPGQRALGFE